MDYCSAADTRRGVGVDILRADEPATVSRPRGRDGIACSGRARSMQRRSLMIQSHRWLRPLTATVSLGLLMGALSAPVVHAQADATPENPCGSAPVTLSV